MIRRRRSNTGWWLPPAPLGFVSPILVDALDEVGFGLKRLLEAIAAPPGDRAGTPGEHPLCREGGSVHLVDAGSHLRRFEIRRNCRCLDVATSLEDHGATITTRASQARLVLPLTMAQTAKLSLGDRGLGRVIDHPLLRRETYHITNL